MATFGTAIRRGLPRSPGGEPWPPAGAAPDDRVGIAAEAPASGASPQVSGNAGSTAEVSQDVTPEQAVGADSVDVDGTARDSRARGRCGRICGSSTAPGAAPRTATHPRWRAVAACRSGSRIRRRCPGGGIATSAAATTHEVKPAGAAEAVQVAGIAAAATSLPQAEASAGAPQMRLRRARPRRAPWRHRRYGADCPVRPAVTPGRQPARPQLWPPERLGIPAPAQAAGIAASAGPTAQNATPSRR